MLSLELATFTPNVFSASTSAHMCVYLFLIGCYWLFLYFAVHIHGWLDIIVVIGGKNQNRRYPCLMFVFLSSIHAYWAYFAFFLPIYRLRLAHTEPWRACLSGVLHRARRGIQMWTRLRFQKCATFHPSSRSTRRSTGFQWFRTTTRKVRFTPK